MGPTCQPFAAPLHPEDSPPASLHRTATRELEGGSGGEDVGAGGRRQWEVDVGGAEAGRGGGVLGHLQRRASAVRVEQESFQGQPRRQRTAGNPVRLRRWQSRSTMSGAEQIYSTFNTSKQMQQQKRKSHFLNQIKSKTFPQ